MDNKILTNKSNKDIPALSVIAFLDEDANFISDNYIFEFCKIALYQNGYYAMTIEQLYSTIKNDILSIDYTYEEIKKRLKNVIVIKNILKLK